MNRWRDNSYPFNPRSLTQAPYSVFEVLFLAREIIVFLSAVLFLGIGSLWISLPILAPAYCGRRPSPQEWKVWALMCRTQKQWGEVLVRLYFVFLSERILFFCLGK